MHSFGRRWHGSDMRSTADAVDQFFRNTRQTHGGKVRSDADKKSANRLRPTKGGKRVRKW